MGIERWFEYESGHAWCESAYKYQTLPVVAEFANSVTNLPIIVLPLVNVFLLRRYIEEVNWLITLPHLLLTFNGIASTYYHATLNLFGQLVDELSLLWLLNTCVVAYLPVMKWFPEKYKDHVSRFRWATVAMTAFISAFCFIKPSLNAFALMSWTIPGAAVIYYEGINAEVPEAASSPWKIFVLWTAATACWFSDRLLCDFWLYLGTPYLHAAFHLLSSVAAYNVFVMFSLLDIHRRRDTHTFSVIIKHFPYEGLFGLPYITLIEKRV
ncbi:unnamed protein product [Toxocara canis]|uniref:Alkaline ceramidase n=1 Tax=Toxocara canis TaxID=6265 RepID=A0A183TXA4_TOXCA|nr:unnamed protein product [Toxocara canis]